jgi:hypothetical protein
VVPESCSQLSLEGDGGVDEAEEWADGQQERGARHLTVCTHGARDFNHKAVLEMYSVPACCPQTFCRSGIPYSVAAIKVPGDAVW